MKAGDVVWIVESSDSDGGQDVRALTIRRVVGDLLTFHEYGVSFAHQARHVFTSEHAAWCSIVAEQEETLEQYKAKRDAAAPKS